MKTACLSVWIVCISVCCLADNAFAQGREIGKEFRVSPSNEQPTSRQPNNGPIIDPTPKSVTITRFGFYCYESRTGKALNCSVEYQFLGVGGFGTTTGCVLNNDSVVSQTCADGGHVHGDGGDTRPDVMFNSETNEIGEISFPGDDPANGLRTVSGFSNVPTPTPSSRTNLIRHDVPQASGYYGWNVQAKMPNGHTFASSDRFSDGTLRVIGRTFVRVRDLVQVQDEPGFIGLSRGGASNHPDEFAYSTTREFREILRLIGFEYTKLSTRVFSINDASLPFGGVFDDKINWRNAHVTHRAGEEVDINRGECAAGTVDPKDIINGVPNPPKRCNCKVDTELFQAIDKYLQPLPNRFSRGPGFPASALLCESGGRKHLNMTELQFFDL